MASLAEQNFNLFSQQEEYSHFADATHPVFTSAPMDMGMTADAFASFVQRAPSQEHYSTSPSTISFEYNTDQAYMMNSATSPGVYGDDFSNMSTGSASSSAVGSPLSNHGQTGMDLAHYGGLNIQPTIAGEFLDYSAFAHGLEDVTHYDFAGLATAKSYVGKSLFSFLYLFLSFFLSSSFSLPPRNLVVAACRGKISSLGDQLNCCCPPSPLDCPSGPPWLLKSPGPGGAASLPQHCTKHCIASQAVPKARCAAADLAHHCRRPLSSTARNHHMLRHHRCCCCCCYFQTSSLLMSCVPFCILTRYCAFVTAASASSWLAPWLG